MKFVVFGGEQRVGLLLGDRIVDLNRASARLPNRLLDLIEAGPSALDEVRRVADEFAGATPARTTTGPAPSPAHT